MVTPVNVHIDPAISNCACKIVFHYKPGPIFEGQTVKSNWRLKATNLTIAGWGPGSSSRSVEIYSKWLFFWFMSYRYNLFPMVYGRYNTGWWFQSLWKIWVRQLGWWNSQLNWKSRNSMPPTSICVVWFTGHLDEQNLATWLINLDLSSNAFHQIDSPYNYAYYGSWMFINQLTTSYNMPQHHSALIWPRASPLPSLEGPSPEPPSGAVCEWKSRYLYWKYQEKPELT